MSTATALAKALGARRSGRGWVAKCPAHNDRNPSLSISGADNGKILVHCHAGCSQDAVIDALRARGLWPNGHGDHVRVDHHVDHRTEHRDRNADTVALVNSLWTEATYPVGTIAEDYLRARKLTVPSELRVVALRFHSACIWESGTTPCLVAAFRSIKNNSLTGITRICLDQPERWPRVERRMLGYVAGSAVKLDPPSDVS